MLARPPSKVSAVVQCPACLGHGVIDLGEDRPICRGCFGVGRMELLVTEDDPDIMWDEAMAMLELAGVDKDPEAYGFQWRGDRWVVVDFEQHRKGALQ